VLNLIIGDADAVLSCTAWGDAATLLSKQCDRAFSTLEAEGKWPYVLMKGMEVVVQSKTTKLSATPAASMTALRLDLRWGGDAGLNAGRCIVA